MVLPHLVVHWKDEQLYNWCTVFVWCLSGLEPIDVNTKVLKGGTTLCLCFAWPDPLQDTLKLTRDAYCRDSSKVVEMETIFKQLKGGTSNLMILSEVEIELGMQVDEEFHNEVNTQGRVEKGDKLLCFSKQSTTIRWEKKKKFPLLFANMKCFESVTTTKQTLQWRVIMIMTMTMDLIFLQDLTLPHPLFFQKQRKGNLHQT